MLTVALTGGIASGKTLVSDAFAALGVPIVDSDVLAREVVGPETPGLHALVAAFGPAVVGADGTLNRPALRQRIFEEPDARETVNDILHPLIGDLADERMAALRDRGCAYAIQVIPLLVETGQHERFDRVLVVDVTRELQLSRLMDRDDSDATEAEAILAAQASRDNRLAIADDIIDNTGDRDATTAAVQALHQRYATLAAELQEFADGKSDTP